MSLSEEKYFNAVLNESLAKSQSREDLKDDVNLAALRLCAKFFSS